MPINLPADLPAFDLLRAEGVRVMAAEAAGRQDIRPMQVAVLNLMPEKPKTESQLARLLGATPLQVELTLLTTATYQSKHAPNGHLQAFYTTLDALGDRRFDGLIVTGAPVELLAFEEVKYWPELQRCFDWAATHVHSCFFICWGAQAALHHYYGVPKHELPTKRFGIYSHRVEEQRDARRAPLTRGLDDSFLVPVSRHTETRRADIERCPALDVLAYSHAAGLCLVQDEAARRAFMFNHLEYDTFTLDDEYKRDLARRDDVQLPINYFPDDDPNQRPVNRWRAYAHLLFGNWLNEVYQTTPYDMDAIGR